MHLASSKSFFLAPIIIWCSTSCRSGRCSILLVMFLGAFLTYYQTWSSLFVMQLLFPLAKIFQLSRNSKMLLINIAILPGSMLFVQLSNIPLLAELATISWQGLSNCGQLEIKRFSKQLTSVQINLFKFAWIPWMASSLSFSCSFVNNCYQQKNDFFRPSRIYANYCFSTFSLPFFFSKHVLKALPLLCPMVYNPESIWLV